MTIRTRTIPYSTQGQAFEGLLAYDDNDRGPRPAVLICHAWAGRRAHEEAFARRLAGLGYAAMAADVYGAGRVGNTNAECEVLMTPLVSDRPKLHARLGVALDALSMQDEVDADHLAATGFCFGGLCALDIARENMPVRGVAAFHAILAAFPNVPQEKIRARVIAFQGFDDPMADAAAQRAFAEEMTSRNADWQLHLYGGVTHAFTNEAANDPGLGLKFHPRARDRAYASFELFLDELFGM